MTEKAQTFWGSEILSTQIRMRLKMFLMAAVFCFLTHIVVIIAVIQHSYGLSYVSYIIIRYYDAKIKASINPEKTYVNLCYQWQFKSGKPVRCMAWDRYQSGYAYRFLRPYYRYLVRKILHTSLFLIWIYPLAFILILKIFHHKAREVAQTEHLRGRKIEPIEVVAARLPKPRRLPLLEGLKMPVEYEPRHILIMGKTGTGKTTIMSQQMEVLRKEKVKVIVYDYKGDYLSKFYRPDIDHIFNPLDTRCVNWNVFNEIRTVFDIQSIATSLIPPSKIEAERYWLDAAREVFSAILHILYIENKRTNRDVWKILSLKNTQIRDYIAGYDVGKAALKFIEDATSKQALGVLSTLMDFTRIFEYMQQLEGDFSLKGWIREEQKGWLFIQNRPEIRDLLRPILSLAVDLLSREVLSLPEDQNRRIFFFVDEIGTLQKLPSLINYITLARSKGGCLIAGVQDLGRIRERYGHELTETIYNNFSTLLCFSIEGETAEHVSRSFGQKEIEEMQESYGMGPEDIRDGLSLIRQKHIKPTVLASEIAALPPFHAFVRLPNGDLTKGKIPKRFVKDILGSDEIFIPHTWTSLEHVAKQEKEKQKQQAKQEQEEQTKEELMPKLEDY